MVGMALLGLRALPSLVLPHSRPKRHTRCGLLSARAAPSTPDTDTSLVATSGSQSTSSVRILRYPDGHERRIIYPAAPAAEIEVETEETWSIWTQVDEDESSVWHDCGLAGAACVIADPDPLVEELAILHNKQHSHQSILELVKDSYQVLTGSPWLLPRPLYVLAQHHPPPPLELHPLWSPHQQHLPQPQQGGAEAAAAGEGEGEGGAEAPARLYCLPTRVTQEEVQDELAMVLKRPSLAAALSCSRLRDGVVAFELPEEAARFATCLEAEPGAGEVDVMEVDSRQLFLLAGEAGAVVVALGGRGGGQFSPLPQQLAAALREGQ